MRGYVRDVPWHAACSYIVQGATEDAGIVERSFSSSLPQPCTFGLF